MAMKFLTRRSALVLTAAALSPFPMHAAERPAITVHHDPSCGCCVGWMEHLDRAGFKLTRIQTGDLAAVKARLGVPEDLAACHTAEGGGYVIEGHVPAAALDRLFSERPSGIGLAVPGMPIGSPGMEGPAEDYDVVLFGPKDRRTFARFRGEQPV